MANIYKRAGRNIFISEQFLDDGKKVYFGLVKRRDVSQFIADLIEDIISLKYIGKPLTPKISQAILGLPQRVKKMLYKHNLFPADFVPQLELKKN